MLNIRTDKHDDELTLELEGRLDSMTSPDLKDELLDSIVGASSLTFDLAGLEYVSSAGLSVFLTAQKTMMRQGTMRLLHVSDSVMEVFDITGFSDILTIE